MDALFNNLKRGAEYTFVFGNGVEAITGVLHEYLPDGTLEVTGRTPFSQTPKAYCINPDGILYVRKERRTA
jgi:hypothetical protein